MAAGVPPKQLWYHDSVLFLSTAALLWRVYPNLIINSCHFAREKKIQKSDKKVSKYTLSLDSSIHLVAYGWDGGKSVGGGGGALRKHTRRWLIHRWRWRADW
jgi:hypothetical protein